jgi:hypothetical protein
MEPQVLTGTISRNDAEGVFVEIPFLGPGSEFGPCEVVADQTLMTRGTRVAVASVEGIVEDYLILGSLESDAASGVVMWWSGIGAPDNLLGSNDDMYLRDDGGVYKKVTGAWVFQFSIKGVQGDPGPSVTGPPGDTIYTGDKNFVPNSGFELINAIHGTTNVFSGWSSFWSGTGAVVVQETVLANVHTGLSCARLDIPANNFARVGMTDPFAVAANEVVTLTMWAKTDSPSATASLALFTNASPVSPDFFTTPGSSILGEQFDLTNVWTQYKCTVIVPAGHDLGKFYLTGQNNAATPQKIWFDDVACYREAASGGQALKIRTFTRRLQRPMGGGGVRTCEVVSGVGKVWWTQPIILENITRDSDTMPSPGHIDLLPPLNGVNVPGYGGAAAQTVAGARIPLVSGTTLYYEHALGASVVNGLGYRIVGHSADFEVPPNWVPIVTYDTAFGVEAFHWFDGRSESGWHYVGAAGEPAFEHSWVNYSAIGAGFTNARFCCRDGVVFIEGLVKSGTLGSNAAASIFTLPAGYRPDATTDALLFAVSANVGAARLDVNGAGAIYCQTPSANGFLAINVSYPSAA